MSPHLNRTFVFSLAISAALLQGTFARAQVLADPPVPSQFASAQTAFLSYSAGSDQRDVDTVYAATYRAIAELGHYRLTRSPSEAELSMVVSHQESTYVFNGTTSSVGYLLLCVYDTKTHALLWALRGDDFGEGKPKSIDKNIAQSITKLVRSLQALIDGRLPRS